MKSDKSLQLHWSEIDRIFDEALEFPLEERISLCGKSTVDRPGIRESLLELLQLSDDAASFLENPILENASEIVYDAYKADADKSNHRIGPYIFGEKIGEGGMGVVYKARRSDVDKTVAIKMMRSSIPTEEQRVRFLSERNVLAKLNHPNIAQLLDAGFTEDGSPFFVMEYVDGSPVTSYCDDEKLSISDRLKIFKSICEAVAFAHQNLVVHRDIKPNNILVTKEGTVKLLDFGIAKIIQDDAGSGQTTSTGLNLMTPAYASPEQVTQQSITTATDVYALGILLYELLSGSRPYDFPTSSPLDVMRIIVEQEPLKPSSNLGKTTSSRNEDDLQQIVANRQTNLAKLSRTIRGDLESVILKALRKEPENRYGTAAAFLNDIERYLDDMPVTAQAPSVGYRTRKFLSRHKAGTAVALITALFLATVSILSLRFAFKTAEQASALRVAEQEAVEERDVARQERENALRSSQLAQEQRVYAEEQGQFALQQKSLAEQAFYQANLDREIALQEKETAQSVTEVLSDVLRTVDPFLALDDSLSQAGLLKVTSKKLSEFNGSPDVKMNLYRTVASIYENRGDYEEAAILLEKALADPSSDPRSHFLTIKQLSDVQIKTSDFDGAASQLHAARDICSLLLPPEDLCVAEVEEIQGYLEYFTGAFPTAEASFKKAITLYEARGISKPEYRAASTGIALTLVSQTRVDEAIPLLDEIISFSKDDYYGDAHATHLQNKANALTENSDYSEAEEIMREVLRIRAESVGINHPKYAQALLFLGVTLRHQAKYEEALTTLTRSLEIYNRTFGSESDRVLRFLSELATTLQRSGKTKEAQDNYQKIVTLRERHFPEQKATLASSYNNLGLTQSQLNQFDDALISLKKSIEIKESLYGESSTSLLNPKQILGFTLFRMGQYDTAEQYVDPTCKQRAEMQGEDHIQYARCITLLAQIYRETDRRQDAISLVKTSLLIRENRLRPNHPLVLSNLRELGRLHFGKEDFVASASYFTQLVNKHWEIARTDTSRSFVGDLNLYAQSLTKLQRFGESEGVLEEALRQVDRVPSKNQRDQTLNNFVELYREWGKEVEADRYLRMLGG